MESLIDKYDVDDDDYDSKVMINVSVIVIFIVNIIILIVSPHHGDQLEAKAIKVAKSMLENKQLLLTLVGWW